MNKEQYLKNKLEGKIDFESAYEMYMETDHPTPKVPLQVFVQVFPMWFQMNSGDVRKYWEFYDKKFDTSSYPILISKK